MASVLVPRCRKQVEGNRATYAFLPQTWSDSGQQRGGEDRGLGSRELGRTPQNVEGNNFCQSLSFSSLESKSLML